MNQNTQQAIQLKSAELNRLARQADVLQQRYTAHLMLYDAACMANNENEAVQRGTECHDLLDEILANTRAVRQRARELQDLMSG